MKKTYDMPVLTISAAPENVLATSQGYDGNDNLLPWEGEEQ